MVYINLDSIPLTLEIPYCGLAVHWLALSLCIRPCAGHYRLGTLRSSIGWQPRVILWLSEDGCGVCGGRCRKS